VNENIILIYFTFQYEYKPGGGGISDDKSSKKKKGESKTDDETNETQEL
jgi:hypothetical protein